MPTYEDAFAWHRVVRPGNERSVAVTRRLGMEPAETCTHPTLNEPALCFRLAFYGAQQTAR